MLTIIIVSLIIILLVIVLSVAAISKGYAYEHTVDPLPNNESEEKK